MNDPKIVGRHLLKCDFLVIQGTDFVRWLDECYNINMKIIKIIIFQIMILSLLVSCEKIVLESNKSLKPSSKTTTIDKSFSTIWKVGDPAFGDGGLSITFPTSNFEAYQYDYTIDWGDGSAIESSLDDTELTHVYAEPGDYRIRILGKFESMTTYLKADKDKLIKVEQLGEVGWKKLDYAFYSADNLKDFEGSVASTVLSAEFMFSFCSKLENVKLSGPKSFNLSSMKGLFLKASNLRNIQFSDFDFSSVTSMAMMFRETTNLTNLDLSNINSSSLTSMELMFYDSGIETLTLSNMDTSRVENMQQVFQDASSLHNLDVTGWDTSRVTNMRSMFLRASSLTSLDLSHFNTSMVTTFYQMFNRASSLTYVNLDWWTISGTSDTTNVFDLNDTTLQVQCDQGSGMIFGENCI